MATVSSPRKGTELQPRVFGTWQEQVNRALRALAEQFAATVSVDFDAVPAQAEVVATETVTGAAVGAAVVVTPVNGPPSGLVFDGYVAAADAVVLRATNVTSGVIDPGAASYRVLVWNP